MIRRFLCWMGIHDDGEWCGRFIFCTRPGCHRVDYWTGQWWFDLDVCDSRWRREFITVQEHKS